jgi:hypothetical protein
MKQCCADAANLRVETYKDTTIAQCRVCGCRHIKVTCDPGRIGLRLKG